MDIWRQQLLSNIESWTESDSDDDIEQLFAELVDPQPATRGGSVIGRSANLDRQRISGHERIMKDYFIPQPVFTENMFRRRFRMRFIIACCFWGNILILLNEGELYLNGLWMELWQWMIISNRKSTH